MTNVAARIVFAVIGALLLVVNPSAQETRPVRVMTWNIAAGHGNLSRIVDVIREARPDIVGLQEVDVHWDTRSAFEDQASRVADGVAMQVRFGQIYRIEADPTAPAREFGLAILSRHPIGAFRNHTIPRLSTQAAVTEPEPMPGFLDAAIDIGGVRVRVFNTHLDYRANPRVRSLQVAAMLKILEDVSGPALLLGDLNAPPSAPELAPLFRRLSDAWREQPTPGLTYPAAAPVRRIDYVLLSPDLRVVAVRVPAVEVSDHRPVIADVAVTPAGARP